MERNTLYYGDCLDVMQEQLEENSVDLIYLDPPFNSKTDYNILYGSSDSNGMPAQVRAFRDTWKWDSAAVERVQRMTNAIAHPAHHSVVGLHRTLGDSGMVAYISYMAERLSVARQLLKSTGSLYLHCDPTASHYLKIVMDNVFGGKNFLNEIVWHYTGGGRSKRYFSRKHDVIFWYSKSEDNHIFNIDDMRVPYKETSGYAKGGITSKAGKHYTPHPEGTPIDSVWDIPIINPMSKERLGYPTQKPIALLEKIIQASSREGDLVLDPFCGCGTTIAASMLHSRQWIGIDISAFAIDIIRRRRFKDTTIPVRGIPTDMYGARHLARLKPLDFETWAVTRLPGVAPNQKQVGDRGIDGRGQFLDNNNAKQLLIAQVKGGKFNLKDLRDFLHVIEREQAALGIYITLDPVNSSDAKKEAANKGDFIIGASRYPRVQLWSIAEHFSSSTLRIPTLPAMLDPFTGKALHPDMFVD